MADQTNTTVDTAAETAKTATDAAAATAKKATETSAATAKKAVRATAPKRAAKTARKTNSKTTRRATAQRRTSRTSAKPEAAAAANQRTNTMNYDPSKLFANFGAFPAAPFQSLFADAGERSQEAVRRSQQAAEEIADLTRANVEALVDSTRIAAEGARSLGQDVVETSRSNVEQTADAVRLLAEAKSATEFVQLQGEFARSSFDRMVAESSRLTESWVKLAGEAFQPISSRASLNAERINKIVA